jgi:hypothetical protein
MSLANKNRLGRALPILLVAGTLAGCADTDLYLDRRDTISLSAGDAVASNIIVQTIDPWPRSAGNRNIPANGDRMQAAGQRYREGKVTPLKGLSTSNISGPSGGGDSGGASDK